VADRECLDAGISNEVVVHDLCQLVCRGCRVEDGHVNIDIYDESEVLARSGGEVVVVQVWNAVRCSTPVRANAKRGTISASADKGFGKVSQRQEISVRCNQCQEIVHVEGRGKLSRIKG
jgi:hypothetical protein